MAEDKNPPGGEVIKRQRLRRRDDYENVGVFNPGSFKREETPPLSDQKEGEISTEKPQIMSQNGDQERDVAKTKPDGDIPESEGTQMSSVTEMIKQFNKPHENDEDPDQTREKITIQVGDYEIQEGEYVHIVQSPKLGKHETYRSASRYPFQNDDSTDSGSEVFTGSHQHQIHKQNYQNVAIPRAQSSSEQQENSVVDSDGKFVRSRYYSAPAVTYPEPLEIETEESDTSTDSGSSYLTDSDFAESDFEDSKIQSEVSSVSGLSISSHTSTRPINTKAYDIIRELVRSEEAYVSKLHLIVRVFKMNVTILNRVLDDAFLPEDKVKVIFSNLDVIFNFHSSNLLPRTQNRLMWWSYNPGVGDIMKSCVPFLKLYLDYSENYQKATDLIAESALKSPQFAVLVKEIENTPESRRLTVQQHLYTICQRPAFYQALLRDYLSALEEELIEKQEIKEALESVSVTTEQLEKAMGREERVKKLQEIEKRLDVSPGLVKANRESVTEGKIWVISPTSGKPKVEYLFVFSDMLLLCSSAGVTGKHKVKFQLHVDGMQVDQSQNIAIPYTFHVKCRNKTVEFHAQNLEMYQQWLECLTKVGANFTKWKLSGLPVGRIHNTQESTALGERAPTLVPLPSTSMCMACGDEFSSRHKRRHCMACGNVTCKKCSAWQMRLKYDQSKLNHVCDECYFTLSMRKLQTNKDKWNTLNVKASDCCLISGHLSASSDRGRHWKKLWFSLREGGVLYSFKAHQDIAALSSLDVLNVIIRKCDKSDKITKTNSFMITGRTTSFFCTETAQEADRWISALTEISKRQGPAAVSEC